MTNIHTDSLHLYSARLCPYAMRVRHVLAEKGLVAELTEIDPRNKPAGFAEISPSGKVPLLVHGQARIWEAAAICEYLEDAFPETALLPEDASARAHARIWTLFADERLYGATSTMLHSRDPEIWKRTVIQLAADVRIVEAQAFRAAEDGPYVLGARISLADVALYPWFDQACVLETFCGLAMPQGERVERWRIAMSARPALDGITKTPQSWIEAYGRLLNAA